jgi:hypothetical protein
MGTIPQALAVSIDNVPTTPVATSAQVAKRTLLQRLFGRARPDLFTASLEMLLATRAITQITRSKVDELRQRYGVPEQQARDVCIGLWRKTFEAFVADGIITDAEAWYLAALREPLGIDEDVVKRLEEELILPRFTAAVQKALAVQRRVAAETDRLARVLRLSDDTVHRVINQSVAAILDPEFQTMVEDHRLSPRAFTEFTELAKGLHVHPAVDAATQELLERYHLLWRIENGEIPAIAVPIALQKSEVCHFACGARWLVLRKQTRTVGYDRRGVRFRVARGAAYRVGQSRRHRMTSGGLTEIDAGTLYITNKRVYFDGARWNSSIRLSCLIAFEPYSDGLMLEKSAGRNPYLILDGDVELAAVLLSALLRQ